MRGANVLTASSIAASIATATLAFSPRALSDSLTGPVSIDSTAPITSGAPTWRTSTRTTYSVISRFAR